MIFVDANRRRPGGENVEGIERRESVVIPTGHHTMSYSTIRSLSSAGVHTIVATECEDVPVAASRFCDEVVSVPSPYEDLVAFKDRLVALTERPDVRTILPIRPMDPYVFSKYLSEFEDHASLVVPPFETIKVVHDRVELAEAAVDADVPVPETRSLVDVDDWDEPVIVKARYNLLADEYVESYSPRDSQIVKRLIHLEPGDEVDREEVIDGMNHVPIVQQFVPSAGQYVFGALYDHGEAVATFQHRQIRAKSYTGGGGVYRKSIANPELETVGRRLLDRLDWHGLACVEFIEDATTGEFKLLELNPRLWMSIPTAIRAGADFPRYYWLQAMGRTEQIDPDYEIGVGTHLLYGELGYIMSIFGDESPLVDTPSVSRTLWEICRSTLEMPYFDYLRFDDPLPFVRAVRHVLRSE